MHERAALIERGHNANSLTTDSLNTLLSEKP